MRWGLLLVVVLAACTERNPEVCCETDAECARVDLTSAVPCASGACVRNLCAASGCDGPEDCGGAACSAQGACESGLDAAGPDAPPATVCAWDTPFAAPIKIGGLDNASLFEAGARLTPDEKTIYLAAATTFQGENQLYRAERGAIGQSFPTPTPLALINTGEPEYDPSVDRDETTLVYAAARSGKQQLMLTTRTSTLVEFQAGAPIANVNGPNDDAFGFLTPDGNQLWFASTRPGGAGLFDVYYAIRTGGAFGAPTRVPELASERQDWAPVLSNDRLTIYFSSDRPGTAGFHDIYRAHRTIPSGSFSAPQRVIELATTMHEYPTFLSADNCRLYVMSSATTTDISVAIRSR